MNYLAHILLAEPTIEAQLGALLGDFSKPGTEAGLDPVMRREIRLHRKIDSFTDAHHEVLLARSMFRPQTRRFAGIALDVFYDHVLSRTWHDHSGQPLPEFISGFYAGMTRFLPILPPRLAQLSPRMIAEDWLGSYGDFAGVELALRRLSRRLSRGGEMLIAGLVDLETHYDLISAGFTRLFPELVAYASLQRKLLTAADTPAPHP